MTPTGATVVRAFGVALLALGVVARLTGRQGQPGPAALGHADPRGGRS